MNRILKAAVLVGVATMMAVGSAYAGIAGSRHDFNTAEGSGGAQGGGDITGVGICVFCHTPHAADTSAPAPLWNKKLASAGGGYSRYSDLGTSSLDGEEAPIGSVTLACLSCHDGSQAMDVVINAPGSGGYNAAGAQISSVSVTVMLGTPASPRSGRIPQLNDAEGLKNDHPVGIQYAGGACDNVTAAGTCSISSGDLDFVTVQITNPNGTPLYWVETSGSVARDKTDMILYARSDWSISNNTGPSVECASCHDPHNGASTPVSFLRINNSGSAVCLACHNK